MRQYPKDYYNRYKRFNYKRLLYFILKDLKAFFDSMPNQKAQLIMDVGCGIGKMTDMLQEYSEIIVGLDISSDVVTIRDRESKSFFITGDALSVPIKEKICDLCLCMHVIEHVKDAGLLLKEMHRITSDGGRIVLITPNRRWARFSLPFLKDKTHVREFAIDELKDMMSRYFHIEKIRPFSMFTSFWFLNPILNRLFKPDIYVSAAKI